MDRAIQDLIKAKLEASALSLKAAQALTRRTGTVMLVLIIVGLTAAFLVGYRVAVMITKPLQLAAQTLKAAAEGDLTARLNVKSTDEIGEMGFSINGFLSSLEDSVRSIVVSAHELEKSASDLTTVSLQIAGTAEETSTQAIAASAATDQVSSSVQTAATGAEQMNASIQEIAKTASEVACVAKDAVLLADKTGESPLELKPAMSRCKLPTWDVNKSNRSSICVCDGKDWPDKPTGLPPNFPEKIPKAFFCAKAVSVTIGCGLLVFYLAFRV